MRERNKRSNIPQKTKKPTNKEDKKKNKKKTRKKRKQRQTFKQKLALNPVGMTCRNIPLTNRVRGPYCKLRTEFFRKLVKVKRKVQLPQRLPCQNSIIQIFFAVKFEILACKIQTVFSTSL